MTAPGGEPDLHPRELKGCDGSDAADRRPGKRSLGRPAEPPGGAATAAAARAVVGFNRLVVGSRPAKRTITVLIPRP